MRQVFLLCLLLAGVLVFFCGCTTLPSEKPVIPGNVSAEPAPAVGPGEIQQISEESARKVASRFLEAEIDTMRSGHVGFTGPDTFSEMKISNLSAPLTQEGNLSWYTFGINTGNQTEIGYVEVNQDQPVSYGDTQNFHLPKIEYTYSDDHVLTEAFLMNATFSENSTASLIEAEGGRKTTLK